MDTYHLKIRIYNISPLIIFTLSSFLLFQSFYEITEKNNKKILILLNGFYMGYKKEKNYANIKFCSPSFFMYFIK